MENVLLEKKSPSVRLAGVGIDINDRQLMHRDEDPTVRLALNPGAVTQRKNLVAPSARLSLKADNMRENRIVSDQVLGGRNFDLPRDSWPPLLVSYVYLEPFVTRKDQYRYRDWVLDSGAYTAHQSGNPVDNEAFLQVALQQAREDETLSEVFALDVIGDWKSSLKNCERAWELGIRAIPTYHIGEPKDYLMHIAATYPKIALGGVANLRGAAKLDWAKDCFARVWPKKIHGFGFGSEKQIMTLPWHSVDASSWATGALKFGNWRTFGKISIRGSNQNLRAEIEHYLKMERAARTRWRKEMELLEKVSPTLPLLIT